MSMRTRFYLGWGILLSVILALGITVVLPGRTVAPMPEPDIEQMLEQAAAVLNDNPDPLADGIDPNIYAMTPPPASCTYREAGEYRAGRIYGFVVIQFCNAPQTTHPDYGAWRAAIKAGDFRVTGVADLL